MNKTSWNSRGKRRALWQVTVSVPAQAEEAASRLLTAWFGAPACTVFDARTGATTVSVFLSCPPRPATYQAPALRVALRSLAGQDRRGVRLRLRRLPPQDWAESWKRHFKPRVIGNQLLLKPGWSRRKPRPGQVVVVLVPGLSFGTGHHPTTTFCLRELVRRRPKRGALSVLDVGTGSGILAIAAAKLGYAPVEGFDSDPEALRVALANARRNRVAGRLRLWRADLTRLRTRSRRRYDLVCANLLTPVLISARQQLADCLQPGGHLIAAGVLATEFPSLQTALARAGLRLCRSRRDGPWRSGTFVLDRASRSPRTERPVREAGRRCS